MQIDKRSFLSAISRVGSWTLLSRVLGLVRDSVVARIFGAGFATDAFMIAFTIPNLLRRLLAEGALSIAFIPIFSEYFSKRSREAFHETFRVLLSVFSLLLVGVGLLGIAISPLIVGIFAPGFGPEKAHLTIQLTRWMFPFIFFVGSASVVTGVLNTLKSFSVPAASPVLLNIAMIGCSVFVSKFFEAPIFALGVGVLLGGVSQWMLQLWMVRRLGFSLKPSFQWNHPAVRRLFGLMAPTIFGVAVYHLNVLVSRALASLLPQGSVTYLYYSDRFLEFPLGIFAISIATVALPHLAEDASLKNLERLKETLFFSLRLAAFICIPAMLGLLTLRVPILSLVFQYGKFSAQDTLALSRIFSMATLGLCAVAGLRITVQAFYSLGDIKTPVKAAFVSLIMNVTLGYILMQSLGAAGLTLASSLAAWVQWGILFFFLRHRLGKLPWADFMRSILSSLSAAVIMALVLWPLGERYDVLLHPFFGGRLFYVGMTMGLGLAVYGGLTWLQRRFRCARSQGLALL